MRAYDTMDYTEAEIERIARTAFEAARTRRNRVHSVDKANVLETSRLWREVVHRLHDAEFSDVELLDQLVDNSAMQLIRNPAQFDVIVTENMFGDILSDEASMLTGSLGMLASASLGEGTALYEPSHGSAPDIAGQGVANPLAMLLSVELMLRHSFAMHAAADELAGAIEDVLAAGWRTRDIASAATPHERVVGTREMGDLVVEALEGGRVALPGRKGGFERGKTLEGEHPPQEGAGASVLGDLRWWAVAVVSGLGAYLAASHGLFLFGGFLQIPLFVGCTVGLVAVAPPQAISVASAVTLASMVLVPPVGLVSVCSTG